MVAGTADDLGDAEDHIGGVGAWRSSPLASATAGGERPWVDLIQALGGGTGWGQNLSIVSAQKPLGYARLCRSRALTSLALGGSAENVVQRLGDGHIRRVLADDDGELDLGHWWACSTVEWPPRPPGRCRTWKTGQALPALSRRFRRRADAEPDAQISRIVDARTEREGALVERASASVGNELRQSCYGDQGLRKKALARQVPRDGESRAAVHVEVCTARLNAESDLQGSVVSSFMSFSGWTNWKATEPMGGVEAPETLAPRCHNDDGHDRCRGGGGAGGWYRYALQRPPPACAGCSP